MNGLTTEDTKQRCKFHAFMGEPCREDGCDMPEIPDCDYILAEGAGWFEVKGFAIRIYRTDEGVAVDIFKSYSDEDAIASCYAFDSELTYVTPQPTPSRN